MVVIGTGEAAEAKRRLVREAGGRPVDAPCESARLAFVAVDRPEGDAEACREAGLLVNVVDRPDLSDFLVPAIVDRDPVTVAIGTGGASASLSKALKERLDLLLPPGVGNVARAIRAARGALASGMSPAARRAFWARLLAAGGPLDPLADHAAPHDIIARARAGADEPVARAAILALRAPGGDPARFDMETLTLGDLRQLSAADLVIHPEATPAALLAFVRRDAARMVGTALPDRPSGRTLLLRFGDERAP